MRSGGSEAMRMPRESSELDQIVRFTPSQVGSLVVTRVFSSMVLKMEQIVALRNISLQFWVVRLRIVGLRDTEKENDTDAPLCPPR